ncbi:hypothetical protein NPIL_54191 [Nephila pilipes]|uniref:Uncharacterized protein n=1 Tax=Nephila pilipes TaxID=299642 RepID=A0A8X6Q4Q5_NEPPI|nr:hypothetical protein NPIL_54191 [Nephila pilipes]
MNLCPSSFSSWTPMQSPASFTADDLDDYVVSCGLSYKLKYSITVCILGHDEGRYIPVTLTSRVKSTSWVTSVLFYKVFQSSYAIKVKKRRQARYRILTYLQKVYKRKFVIFWKIRKYG